MKTYIIFGLTFIVSICGCTQKELTRPDALKILQTLKMYPKTVDYTLYCGDARFAGKVAESSLVTDGYVVMAEVRSADKPFFEFTPKATPFLLKGTDRERELAMQTVKVADETLIDVTAISTDANRTMATVFYTTRLENLSPFAVLLGNELKVDKSRKAFFKRYDNGWRFEKADDGN